MSTYNPAKTAVVLIGYQNDWCSEDGDFNRVFEDSAILGNALANTCLLYTSDAADASLRVDFAGPLTFHKLTLLQQFN